MTNTCAMSATHGIVYGDEGGYPLSPLVDTLRNGDPQRCNVRLASEVIKGAMSADLKCSCEVPDGHTRIDGTLYRADNIEVWEHGILNADLVPVEVPDD